jgi:hypothetical protein
MGHSYDKHDGRPWRDRPDVDHEAPATYRMEGQGAAELGRWFSARRWTGAYSDDVAFDLEITVEDDPEAFTLSGPSSVLVVVGEDVMKIGRDYRDTHPELSAGLLNLGSNLIDAGMTAAR